MKLTPNSLELKVYLPRVIFSSSSYFIVRAVCSHPMSVNHGVFMHAFIFKDMTAIIKCY